MKSVQKPEAVSTRVSQPCSRDFKLISLSKLNQVSPPIYISKAFDRQVKVIQPVQDNPFACHHSGDSATKYFYRILNCTLDLMDIRFSFETFTAIDILAPSPEDLGFQSLEPIKRRHYEERVRSMETKLASGQIEIREPLLLFHSNLYRMAQTVVKNSRDLDTHEAISYLAYLARNGGKILLVDVHGFEFRGRLCVGYTKTGILFAEDALRNIQALYRPGEVDAVYLAACNPGRVQLNTNCLSIPFIYQVDNNSPQYAPAKLIR